MIKSANLALSDIQLIFNHTTLAPTYEMKAIAFKFHIKSFFFKKGKLYFLFTYFFYVFFRARKGKINMDMREKHRWIEMFLPNSTT